MKSRGVLKQLKTEFNYSCPNNMKLALTENDKLICIGYETKKIVYELKKEETKKPVKKVKKKLNCQRVFKEMNQCMK